MRPQPKYETFLEKLNKLALLSEESQSMSLEDVLTTLGYSSHLIVILFFAIPFLQPIPLPGISSLFGIFIALCSIGIVFSRKMYLPKFLKKQEIPSKKIHKMTSSLIKISLKIERWIHPRGKFMGKHALLRKLNGSLLFLAGLALALPLPVPLTNTFPAYAITAICLGSLKEDGILVGIGWLLFILAIAYNTMLTTYSIHLLGSIFTH